MTFVPAPPRRPAPAPVLAPARGSRLARWTSALAVALTASSTAAARPAEPAPLARAEPAIAPPVFSDIFKKNEAEPARSPGASDSRGAAPSPVPSDSRQDRGREPASARGTALLARREPAPSTGEPPPPSPAPADSGDEPAPSASSPAPASPDAGAEEPVPEDSERSERKLEGPGDAAAVSTPETAAEKAAEAPTSGAKPPRVDGTYVGGTIGPGISFARVNDFPTPNPFAGGGATFRVGEVIYPWMSVGIEISGNLAYRSADPRQRLLQGAFLVDFGFYPLAKKQLPLSLRAGFGAGGGAIRERGRTDRSGFGGAVFTAAARYEFFPGAARRRPTRGGGFSIGPELGWIGFMPAAKGRPMSHTVYLGLFVGFYFGS
ncbi:hypothetical protein [Nannocystis pusilla]|uniref:Outer membrane protein beta-barrel domain-containing protein n=1 Tax=Nannocystis pusilla TaxID=889268 RepID=A0ABS7U2I9_9BACT|nr:hypothetical protein [Nannocystis pusilla]MBZ5714664.1 hypothetical protein [Nannocystis pusilla]